MEKSLQDTEAIERVLQRLARRAPSYARCVQTTVCERTDNGWRNLLTKFEATRSDDASSAPFVFDFAEVLLLRRVLSLEAFKTALRQLAGDRTLGTGRGDELADLPTGFSNYGMTRFSHSEWVHWPADIFTLEPLQSAPWSLSRSLVATGAPYFTSADQILSEYFTIRPTDWHGQFRGQVVVVLPDYRARIIGLTVAPLSFEARIDYGLLGHDGLLLKGLALSPLGTPAHFDVQPVADVIERELDDRPTFLSIALVDVETGETIQEKMFKEGAYSDPQVLIDVGLPEVEQLLLTGESRTVELKLRLNDTAEKLAKTAVAFANTDGGTIVYGVDDDHQVIGCETKGVSDRITSMLRTNCDPCVDFKPRIVNYLGKTLFLVDVFPSAATVHVVRDKGPYIRANGSNRIPTNAELTRLFRSRTGVGSQDG